MTATAAQEQRAGASNLRVLVEGLAAATCFSENDIAALHRHDKIGALFDPATGKIKSEYRRALSGAEARAKLAKRNPDGSPRPAPAAPDFYGLAPETRDGRWLSIYLQCPSCGHGHDGPPAGAGTTRCTRCGSNLSVDQANRIPGIPAVSHIGAGALAAQP